MAGRLLGKLPCDKLTHGRIVVEHRVEERELVVGTHKIVLGILDFVVGVAVDIVGEETHGLHVGEEGGGIGKIFNLYGEKETLGALEISLGEGTEDVHVKFHLVDCGIILGHLVGSGT